MTQMIEVKTAELIGMALDYAAGISDGRELELPSAFRGRTSIVWCDPFVIRREGRPDFYDKTRRKWSPSTDWAQGGPLIEKYKLDLGAPLENQNGPWNAGTEWGHPLGYKGDTPLIAACRAIVAAKLGDVVSVPTELLP